MVQRSPQSWAKEVLVAVPTWLFYCFLSIFFFGVWGLVSKAAIDLISPFQGQILFSIGLLPLGIITAMSKDIGAGNKFRGVSYGFLTGIFGSIGNVAFFEALSHGGRASTVVPVTAMYPLVTVIGALLLLREKLNWMQVCGVALALGALILFSL
jgi:bacterial/archaeal transporter family protein